MPNPPLLLADSGSTKTHWCLLAEKGPQHWTSPGINPHYQTGAEIAQSIVSGLDNPAPLAEAKEVFFYGAGVSHSVNEAKVSQALRQHCPEANLHVTHDLLGAARATAANQAALVGILGTGANLCQFDGDKITKSALSLGYLLSDEGSGAVIGQHVVAAYLKGTLPPALAQAVDEHENMALPHVLDRLYRQSYPNRYLATFARIVLQKPTQTWARDLLLNQFRAYFKAYLPQFPEANGLPLHLVGSVAYHGQALLREAAADYGVSLGEIVASPMEGLIAYHQKNRL